MMIHIAQGRQGDIYALKSRDINENDNIHYHKNKDEEGQLEHSLASDEIDVYGGLKEWQIIKTVYAPLNGVVIGKQPHNIVKEVNLLKRINHPNITTLLRYTFNNDTFEHQLIFPLYAITLNELFQDSSFPFEYEHEQITHIQNNPLDIPKYISYQLLQGINYLHNLNSPISHLDLNPSNILLDWNGLLKIIDFGISFSLTTKDQEEFSNCIKEEDNEFTLFCDVGTGSYRAPELLFSPIRYDPLKIDLWAIGCIIAQLFRPFESIEINSNFGSESSSSSSSSSSTKSSLIEISNNSIKEQFDIFDNLDNLKFIRKPLFNSKYGSLGLSSSIFKILGTPTKENWPDFENLPDSSKINFPFSKSKKLLNYLPELNKFNNENKNDILEIIEGLLKLDPNLRKNTKEILNFKWFNNLPLIQSNEIMRKYLIIAKSNFIRKINEDTTNPQGRVW
ncbi:uncharacterized protein I206_106222 [Kwoniella pini CBS 10737]|uniref:CMGC/CDK protein kinase n=1 Tax=Kwoniella pini CBS 10737 TaxID=1296096 RepID=A0A1B9I1H1_9TREE|nr:CMGC/CDK protein kinase [Kwoniella pini CBS 10737]OCF49355.1 CMGC/CDK protein kinase [Kwoniella pini CBS 10737]